MSIHHQFLDTVSQSQSNGKNNRAPNFDTSTVVILSALLCALIFALGLNSMVRCALRCGNRQVTSNSSESTGGVKKKTLRRIPVTIYGSSSTITINETECPICLGEFVNGEKMRILPKCNHGFHISCIDTWLSSHSSCPTCRHSVLDLQVEVMVVQEIGDR